MPTSNGTVNVSSVERGQRRLVAHPRPATPSEAGADKRTLRESEKSQHRLAGEALPARLNVRNLEASWSPVWAPSGR
jgi:hypothetical protein